MLNINDYEFEIVLPKELENSITINEHFKIWYKIVKESQIQRLKETRLKKLNKINAKIK